MEASKEKHRFEPGMMWEGAFTGFLTERCQGISFPTCNTSVTPALVPWSNSDWAPETWFQHPLLFQSWILMQLCQLTSVLTPAPKPVLILLSPHSSMFLTLDLQIALLSQAYSLHWRESPSWLHCLEGQGHHGHKLDEITELDFTCHPNHNNTSRSSDTWETLSCCSSERCSGWVRISQDFAIDIVLFLSRSMGLLSAWEPN